MMAIYIVIFPGERKLQGNVVRCWMAIYIVSFLDYDNLHCKFTGWWQFIMEGCYMMANHIASFLDDGNLHCKFAGWWKFTMKGC